MAGAPAARRIAASPDDVEPHPFHRYSREVLAFHLQGAPESPPPLRVDAAAHDRALARVLRMVEETGRRRVVLFGYGEGRFAEALVHALPEHVALALCESPAVLRRAESGSGMPCWVTPTGPHQLLADDSSWALGLALTTAGVHPESAVILHNPEAPRTPLLRDAAAILRLPRRPLPIPATSPETQARDLISVMSILHPEEPRLEEFIAQIPEDEAVRSRLHEWVVLWDAPTVADAPAALRRRLDEASPLPVRHHARPLAGDFAAQRNHALGVCAREWTLMLDGDERLAPAGWAALTALAVMATATTGADGNDRGPALHGFWTPRRTLYPDAAHCKAGYGLWPDLQLRLFRRTSQTRFERPVHERLRGLGGPTGVVAAPSLLHHSRLLKDEAALAAKLVGFDRASATSFVSGSSSASLRHRLNLEYPTIPLAVLDAMPGALAPTRHEALVLCGDPA